MPETSDKEPAGRGWIVPVVSAALIGVTAIFGLFLAQRSGRPITIKFGDTSLNFSANPELTEVLDDAIAKDAQTFEAILSTKGYYRLTSPQLIDALARLDTGAAENKVVTEGMRQLLWDLNGPFRRPGTLSGADERLLGALEELEGALATPGQTSRLLAEIWQRSLERTSVFRPRSFNAEVVPVSGGAAADGAVVIFSCPGNELVGKQMTLWTSIDNASFLVTGEIADDVQRFDCGDSGQTLAGLLGGQPLRLGLDATTFAKLADPGGVIETLPATVTAKFQVHPKYLTAVQSSQ